MPKTTSPQQQAKILRRTRRVHRWTGLALFVFFFVIGITSILLAWKKDSDYLMPPTSRGSSAELNDWRPAHELLGIAQAALRDSLGAEYDLTPDRLDFRPGKGSVKVLFENHYQEVQLDASTGEVLSIGARRADFIEHVHDGSIVNQPVKVIYSTLMGLAVLVFTVSGFWLWYGPRRMRKAAKS